MPFGSIEGGISPAPKLLHIAKGGRGYSEYWQDAGTTGGAITWKKIRIGCPVKANTLRAVYYGFSGTSTNLPVTGDGNANPTRVMFGYQIQCRLKRVDGGSVKATNHVLHDPKGGTFLQLGDMMSFNVNGSSVSYDTHKPFITPKLTITMPIGHEQLPSGASFLAQTYVPADTAVSTKYGSYQHYSISGDGEGSYVGGAVSQNKWFGSAEVDPLDVDGNTTGPNLVIGEPVSAGQRSFLILGDSTGEGYSTLPTTTVNNKNYNWQYAPEQSSGHVAKALKRLGVPYAGFNQGGAKLSQTFPGYKGATYWGRYAPDFDPIRFGVIEEILPFFTDVILVFGTNDFAANWMQVTNGTNAYMELLTAACEQLRASGIKRVYVCTIPPQTQASGFTAKVNAYLDNPSAGNATTLVTAQSIQLNSSVEANRKAANTAIVSSIPTWTDGSPLWRALPVAAAVTTTNGGAEVFVAGGCCPDGIHIQYDNESGASPVYGSGTVVECGQTLMSKVIAPTSDMAASLLAI